VSDPARPTLPRNGCHNRKPLLGQYVSRQFGWTIDNAASKDCQYSKTTVDERCDGCKWRQSK
jgi:hypothetical protein